MGSYGKHYIEESAVFVWVIRMVEPLSKKDVFESCPHDDLTTKKVVEVGRVNEQIKALRNEINNFDWYGMTKEGLESNVKRAITRRFGGLK